MFMADPIQAERIEGKKRTSTLLVRLGSALLILWIFQGIFGLF